MLKFRDRFPGPFSEYSKDPIHRVLGIQVLHFSTDGHNEMRCMQNTTKTAFDALQCFHILIFFYLVESSGGSRLESLAAAIDLTAGLTLL